MKKTLIIEFDYDTERDSAFECFGTSKEKLHAAVTKTRDKGHGGNDLELLIDAIECGIIEGSDLMGFFRLGFISVLQDQVKAAFLKNMLGGDL